MSTKNTPPAEKVGFNPTADEIAALTKKYGDVHQITVVDDRSSEKKEYNCVVKRPDRKILSMAMQFGQNNQMKFNETIFTNCWIDGDPEIKSDEYLSLAAEVQCSQIVKVAESSIKKL